MKILGIDPGLRITGFGLIEKQANQLHYIASGTVRTDSQTTLPERLKIIFESIRQIAAQYEPDVAAVEKVFVNVNPQSTLLLGQARGAALCGLIYTNLPVFEYTALQLKQAVVGYGRARKEQVQDMVMRLLSLSACPSADAADALGMAICHAHGGGALSKLADIAPQLTKKGFRVKRGRLIG